MVESLIDTLQPAVVTKIEFNHRTKLLLLAHMASLAYQVSDARHKIDDVVIAKASESKKLLSARVTDVTQPVVMSKSEFESFLKIKSRSFLEFLVFEQSSVSGARTEIWRILYIYIYIYLCIWFMYLWLFYESVSQR